MLSQKVFEEIFGQAAKPDPKPLVEDQVKLMRSVINRFAPLVSADSPLAWEKTVENRETKRRFKITVKLEEL
jgi:hypothetical protein